MTDEMLEAYFVQLQREYLVEAPARLGELRKDLGAIRAGEPEAVDSLKSRFHRLAGSGGSYGFPTISDVSREAEEWLGDHPSPDATGVGYLEAAIGRVASAFDAAAQELGYPEAPTRQPPFGWRAHLLGGASDTAARLTLALREAQYSVTRAPLSADPTRIPASERPELAIVVPAGGEDPGPAVASWTAGPFERYLAVALVADPQSCDRLSEPYAQLDLFIEPERADVEVPRWARAVARAAAVPPAALVILGDEDERALVTGWLESAGVRVTAASLPSEGLDYLRREIPDLVLLDWDLEKGHAAALVRVLRRMPRFALTPVVAVSGILGEAESEEALAAGVDQLMGRPLNQTRLTPVVIHRVARARRLDEAVRRDALTGFLTAGTLSDELELLVAYARREKEQLSFLLLDVDHFRRVNEQLGHETGDQVLVQLARVLRERVRASDPIVRMGGEEFAVMFRHCTPANALRVAEMIRAAVVAAPPIVEGTPLPVRFSAGIATYPDHAMGARELILAAERALREAKETGRDRVVTAGRKAEKPA